MKKILSASLVSLAICFPALSWGSELIFGINTYSFDYQESLPANLKSTEKATVFAPFVYGNFPAPGLGGKSFIKFEAEVTGSTRSDFDGTTQGGTPVKDTNYQSFIRAEGDGFLEFLPDTFAYVGLGIRYWNRFLSGGSGYREIYTWWYAPIGVLYQIPLSNNMTLGLDASYRMMFAGQIKVIFSETVAGGDDTTLNLGNKPGFKLQAPLRYAFEGGKWGLTLIPWYEVSEIDSSDVKYNANMAGSIQEPASKTIQYGLASGLSVFF